MALWCVSFPLLATPTPLTPGRTRGELYRTAVLRSTPAAAWYAQNAWCVKCNLFGDSPCRDDYLAFNVHRERMADAAAAASATATPGSAAGTGVGIGSAAGVEEATALDDYLGRRLMACFMGHTDLLTPQRLAAAERAAVAAQGPGKGGSPPPYTGPTHTVVAQLQSRLGALAEVAASLAPPPHLAHTPAPVPPMSTKDLATALLEEVRVLAKALSH